MAVVDRSRTYRTHPARGQAAWGERTSYNTEDHRLVRVAPPVGATAARAAVRAQPGARDVEVEPVEEESTKYVNVPGYNGLVPSELLRLTVLRYQDDNEWPARPNEDVERQFGAAENAIGSIAQPDSLGMDELLRASFRVGESVELVVPAPQGSLAPSDQALL